MLKSSSLEDPPRLHWNKILPLDRGSVQTLAPAIEETLKQADLRVCDLEFLSVTVGPGSFTGLRVGLATAKMLAMAGGKPIVPVDTLAAVARRFAASQCPTPGQSLRLVTAINAYRKQLFTASWFIDSSGLWNVRPSSVVDLQAWLDNPWGAETPTRRPSTPVSDEQVASKEQLASDEQLASKVWISGAALEIYPLPSERESHFRAATADVWQPLAEDVGVLAWEGYRKGTAVSAAHLLPNYIRSSAAEEKRKSLAR